MHLGSFHRSAWLAVYIGLAALLSGCVQPAATTPAASMVERGEVGRARVDLALLADAERGGKRRLLFEQQASHAALLEGVPRAAARRIEYVYDTLRTQGLNEDNSADLFVVSEASVRFWKGEPFEQAMMLCLIAVADMSTGRWGNARAAAIEASSRVNASRPDDAVEFPLARLLAGVANLRLGRGVEAAEHFSAAVTEAPRLATLADELSKGEFDALLVVEVGSAPAKTAAGTDQTEIVYRERFASDDRALIVRDAAGRAAWPVVADLNDMARDLRWTGLDEGRRNKSAAGSVLTTGGIAVATSSDEPEAQLAGVGAALIGLIAKANARADTRHNDLLPQRVYLAPIRLGLEPPTLAMEGSGRAFTPLGLLPSDSGLTVRLVRLIDAGEALRSTPLYANDVTGPLAEPTWPYILGGRCVRTPRRSLMSEYRQAGLPERITHETLLDLYRAEGVEILDGPDVSRAKGHVLQGGSTLFTPHGGTLGFSLLMGRLHPPYVPQSPLGRSLSLAVSPDEAASPGPSSYSN